MYRIATLFICLLFASTALCETLRHPLSLEQQLKNSDASVLANQARTRGDSRRGALVFYKSAAACVHCHVGSGDSSPLGPDLAKLGDVTDVHMIESLLYPSKVIRKEFQTHSILTVDGEAIVGMIAKQDQQSLTLRVASDLTKDFVIAKDDVEAMRTNDQSMMPEGLIGALGEQRDFLDLVKYIMDVAKGGPDAAQSLMPSPEDLEIRDDTIDLDHSGIIKKFGTRDFDTGKSIYHGYCFNCHGADGNTPSLPTARAFGTQKLRFGSDPYLMFMTLSHGKGLMAPMSHLTPKERYQVVHYIREAFMKPANPDYFDVTKDYLNGLPKGSENGTKVDVVERDFGPALASQLRRDYRSVLTIPLGKIAISYDLHTMDQAGIWRGGKLDLSETQHARDRGEGTAGPDGVEIKSLSGWQWGHEGGFDYPKDQIAPRGPMPQKWMNYRGHHLFGRDVILSYEIDGRPILEWPHSTSDGISHALQIGPGRSLVLAVADETAGKQISGDIADLTWSKHHGRAVLNIPADDQTRNIQVTRSAASAGNSEQDAIATERSPRTMTGGGPTLWPDVMETVGTLGLEKGVYAMDTITLPDSTPWKTWFRTSGIDFLSDGRMVLSTYGGDIWIVSGIDEQLLNLRWKRFAAGMYEPMGVKVVDDSIYVTCKDRIIKLHDADGNQEADFYESFSADSDVSPNFHAFNFDLQTDQGGNFYYAKSGHGADTDLPGAVFKISPDGQQREVFSTGFRTPNGMGALPDGRMTVSDNQGQWTPASKINLLRPGGYYGWVPTYSIPGMWEPGSGTIDVKKVVPPETFDAPLVWMPQEFDSSSGGQLWANDPRFGPLSEHLLHTSFGKGWMSYLMVQDVSDVDDKDTAQAAIIKLPFNFRTGIMRANTNPADGQVYATGLQGWNGGGRMGLLSGGVQRLRYKGGSGHFVTDCQVEPDGLKIKFNFAIDPESLKTPHAFNAKQWNYLRQASYGSEMYSPSTNEVGTDDVTFSSATVGSDATTIKLVAKDLQAVNQLHLILRIKAADGSPFEEEIYWTINAVPK